MPDKTIEEIEKESQEETKETQETQKPKENKIEIIAKEMGWVSKEDFNGEKTDYVDAETYIRRGRDIQDNMRKSLKEQRQQLNDMAESIEALKSHNERVYKTEISKLKAQLTTLKSQKKEAVEDGNVEKVNEIDEQIDYIKGSIDTKEPEKSEKVNEKPELTPEFKKWLNENPWYETDDEMAAVADNIAREYKGISFQRLEKLVDKKIKEVFPDKFSSSKTSQQTDTVSRVEGSSRKQSGAKFTETDLSDSQKSIMNQFVRQGIMTKKQYIEDIASMAGDVI
jgi:hypothetical protein